MTRHGGMTHSHRPSKHRNPPTVPLVMRHAAALFGVTYDDLTGSSRTRPLVQYRQVTMAACRELTAASYPALAQAFHRDHTTVMHACQTVADDTEKQRLLHLLLSDLNSDIDPARGLHLSTKNGGRGDALTPPGRGRSSQEGTSNG